MDLIQRRRQLMTMQDVLPSIYKRVSYIGAENACPYIDTDTYLTAELECEIHFYNDKTEAFVFGARPSTSTSPYNNLNIVSDKAAIRFDYYNKKTNISTWKTGENIFTFKNNVATLTNLTTGETKSTAISGTFATYTNKPILLFAAYTGSTASLGVTTGIFRIYDAKFWIGNSLVLDLIPCVRKADNKPGMYNTVTKIFHTSVSADEFVVPS